MVNNNKDSGDRADNADEITNDKCREIIPDDTNLRMLTRIVTTVDTISSHSRTSIISAKPKSWKVIDIS